MNRMVQPRTPSLPEITSLLRKLKLSSTDVHSVRAYISETMANFNRVLDDMTGTDTELFIDALASASELGRDLDFVTADDLAMLDALKVKAQARPQLPRGIAVWGCRWAFERFAALYVSLSNGDRLFTEKSRGTVFACAVLDYCNMRTPAADFTILGFVG